ncbi:phosphoglucomutase (alpha-D-glucose-1,6-bisphosphate-dependent) [Bifidobacterium psychraerophilum]|jgi:phosphoglucomutase|uniref:phosphoglucomutase (alpha-D-glucose-1,6-bisphosphate-dependent) n=1 Tax=Bifidobacterium psychraerophilum TaxID=218140 RepID=UPI0023F2BA25|nr:phosphoglucomutase (alpha-D-glucose-1,6-bisphosphate-dependent) [Bifidobacterium psychraerophilum]MCI1661027.1 phosphoglucomutase (alpha-D-glucose-1,6-bisphosphate-dependent) [Bifidobacterium psychraerophilum]MCI1804067.1 phosphoglucomutase (alpha-D-glucose-1,6-bisphosphate-dependent) [Bifidobacterium psychraerophilum]MCI2176572.1 phosphoglucomutase (alpha-D-glucose-1,6-bisphosphate-dependent) [Bifidobacterium psychraerophilum]MCI2182318.1 phosphoglucomutase (alpha-D-glucose-1,6-bisphosphate
MVANNAGLPATPEDLINVDDVIGKYYDAVPDSAVAAQRVIFGTSGHRGSSLKTSFNEAHIVAITQAIAEHRKAAGISGPLYIGRDTHALSLPAWKTAVEVLVANGVRVRIDANDDFTPTPTISQAILTHNRAADGTQRFNGADIADGIVVTPSHNPPTDGGFKYDLPTGGPAPEETTNAIATRANELLDGYRSVKRIPFEQAVKSELVESFDYREHYVSDLANVIDFDLIRSSGVRLGIDPLGGASVHYWPLMNEKYGLDIGVINPETDPTWRFMTIDHDGKIRIDPSSPYAMKGLVDRLNAGAWDKYDLVGGTDPDADRHGIVCPGTGVMNPNHYIAVCVEYLFSGNRPGWPEGAGIGKTLVSSSLIDRVAASIGDKLVEVPVGFKWFVDPLFSGEVAFGGEESSGMSFLRKNGRVWTTDKDGLIPDLLAAEITAKTGKNPSQLHEEQVQRFGESWYKRVDTPTTLEQKQKFAGLSGDAVTASTLAGEDITAKLTEAPGNHAKIGGLKVTTKDNWFAARPSGTENIYKVYAESFVSPEALDTVLDEATQVVDTALEG